MVNFNDGQTVISPIPNVTKLLILEKRENYLLAQEGFDKLGNNTSESLFLTLKGRLLSLYNEIEPLLYKRLKADLYKELETLVNGDDADDIKKAFKFLNRFIYSIGITYIDTKPYIADPRRVESVHAGSHI